MIIYFVSYDLIRLLSRLQKSLVRCNKLRERNKLEYKIRKPNKKISQHLIRIATFASHLQLLFDCYKNFIIQFRKFQMGKVFRN